MVVQSHTSNHGIRLSIKQQIGHMRIGCTRRVEDELGRNHLNIVIIHSDPTVGGRVEDITDIVTLVHHLTLMTYHCGGEKGRGGA